MPAWKEIRDDLHRLSRVSPGASTPSPESTAGAAVGSGDQGGGGGEDGGREEGNGMSKRPVTTATGAFKKSNLFSC